MASLGWFGGDSDSNLNLEEFILKTPQLVSKGFKYNQQVIAKVW
jgi:hypothetical protein